MIGLGNVLKGKEGDSIAVYLLRVIFTVYFFTTLIITSVQLVTVYIQAKQNVTEEIHSLAEAVHKSLADSLWEFSNRTIESTIQGVLRHPAILAVEIYDEAGKNIFTAGTVPAQISLEGRSVSAENLVGDGLTQQNTFEYPLSYTADEQEYSLGKWIIHATDKNILAGVQQNLIQIAINFLVGVFILWWMLLFIIRRILERPLVSLTNSIKDARLDNLENVEWDVDYRRKDELTILRSSFQTMIKNLLASRREYENLTKDLERQVRSRTHELLSAKEQAESANRAKSGFLAHMSHELRTPLNSVLGFSEVMARSTDVSDEQKGYLDIINRNGYHLLGLINDVLDMSKIEAGHVELEKEPVDLAKQLRGIEGMFRLRAEEKNLSFQMVLGSDVPYLLQLDIGKLRQVLINLLSNAIKFTQEGGVTLQVENSDKKGWLRFEVGDSGPGIEDDQREDIFQPFTQAHTDNSGQYEGTGLGLSISRQFVQLMGGELGVQSKPGDGARFYFEMPAELASAGQPIREEVKRRVIGLEPGQTAPKVLIVDDRADNRLLMENYLKTIECEVKQAADGQQAIDMFQDWRPDMICMDIRMPIMDGNEATRLIRALEGGDEVKILALTGDVFRVSDEDIRNNGYDNVLQKPFRKEKVLEAIKECLMLRYRYEDDTEYSNLPVTKSLTREDASQVSTVLSDKLLIGLHDLNHQLVLAAIEEISFEHPEIGRQLGELASQYDYEKLLALFRSRHQKVP